MILYPKAYIDFLVYFHGARDYFECHEILEEYWKQHDPNNRSSVWVGLIQVAVALYHHRTGNFNGSYRLLYKAINNIDKHRKQITALGLDFEQMSIILKERLAEINDRKKYYSINLPIQDENLLETCKEQCLFLGLNWNDESDFANHSLIYKHSMRDRSKIKKEREKQLSIRKNERPDS